MAKKRVTINDIAQQADVSKTTVSRYLNGHFDRMSSATRQRIARVIKQAHYQASFQARSLTNQRSHLVGMVVADVENIFSSILFRGADEIFSRAGYQIVLMNSDNSADREREQLQRLLQLQVDGIILQAISRHAADYQYLEESGIPVVLVDRELDENPAGWPVVRSDNYRYSRMLCDYLVHQGYQKIVVINQDVEANNARRQRYQAALDAVKGTGCQVELPAFDPGENNSQLYANFSQLPGWLNPRTVLYMLKGTDLMRVMKVLAQYNVHIPEDLGVTAFDDWDWATLTQPQITTIQQDPRQLGTVAANKIMALLSDQPVPPLTNVDCRFQVRHSLKTKW
ncbi:LacI family DNA-binding transcriptional regulator [[Lactobacillus] timonensis]|jgi:LacI family kdg operon repressor|uniref:LacI family DNA-binding transcriptional regulator n=1 Tax=[Lactobacillus] timonensis TaxID=1970790 RepID=UPI000C818450|nr:LacI family DNA-binding transcriptional regulator [[Lactobacillus] timonensis]